MKKFTWDEFIDLIDTESASGCTACCKENFKGWEKLTKDMDARLKHCGEFKDSEKYINKNGYTEYHPKGTNYWSKDAPIALAFYPYHESLIRQCNSCKAVFLTYTEYAGHAPQNRCRWAQKKLISQDTEL